MELILNENSYYLLVSEIQDEITICIKSDSEIQVENVFSTVFVFKKNNLKIIANSKKLLQIWTISKEENHEIDLIIPEFPLYKSCTVKESRNFSNNLKLNIDKQSDFKKFIQSLFLENSMDFAWISVIDGNCLEISFKNDQVEINSDDPVVLNRLLRIILKWAQFPISILALNLDQCGFRSSLRFWIQEIMKITVLTPIQMELLEIRVQENNQFDYFDEEFLDEFKKIDSGLTNSKQDNFLFTVGFIQSCVNQIIYEYFMSKGANIDDIEKVIYLVGQVMKNPDIELIESIIFGATNSSTP